jgi:hypothetical protein
MAGVAQVEDGWRVEVPSDLFTLQKTDQRIVAN